MYIFDCVAKVSKVQWQCVYTYIYECNFVYCIIIFGYLRSSFGSILIPIYVVTGPIHNLWSLDNVWRSVTIMLGLLIAFALVWSTVSDAISIQMYKIEASACNFK